MKFERTERVDVVSPYNFQSVFNRGTVGNWIHRIMVALSQLLNALFGGMPDETLSCRIHRTNKDGGSAMCGLLEALIDWIFYWEVNHCFLAWLDEVNRRHVHPDIIVEQNKRIERR